MSTIGYYPGCSLGSSAAEYDRSVRFVAARLGVAILSLPTGQGLLVRPPG